MSHPIPTRSEPAEIPLTDRHWRERWAQELTRANALERELEQTRRARDAARKTNDDLTKHCEGQGLRIERLEAQLNRALHNRDTLAEVIEEECYDRDTLRGIVERAGLPCPECNGTGWFETFSDVLHGDTHTTRDERIECPNPGCFDGRVLR